MTVWKPNPKAIAMVAFVNEPQWAGLGFDDDNDFKNHPWASA